MPKVIQMPRRKQSLDKESVVHSSMILPDASEESESVAKVQHWLDIADAALAELNPTKKQTA